MKSQKLENPAGLLLILLLVTDIFLIAIHVLFYNYANGGGGYFLIYREQGLGESFQSIKLIWVTFMFILVAMSTRQLSYLVWATTFGYLGIDDGMTVHEILGEQLALRWAIGPMFGLRPADIGELVYLASVGTILLFLLSIAWWRGSATFRERSKFLVALSALLVIVGIGVDVVHAMLYEVPVLDELFGIIENGGEMLIVSVLVWYTFKTLCSDMALANTPEVPLKPIVEMSPVVTDTQQRRAG